MRSSLLVFLAIECMVGAFWALACVSRKAHPNAHDSASTKAEQAVLVFLDGVGLPDEVYSKYDLQGLEERVVPVLRSKQVGEFDGEETRNKETVLYFYGPDSEALYAAIEPELRAYPLCRGARVVIRKGPPGAPSREVRLPSSG